MNEVYDEEFGHEEEPPEEEWDEKTMISTIKAASRLNVGDVLEAGKNLLTPPPLDIDEDSLWVHFWDMHSGGPAKEPATNIYIECDDQEEAVIIFINRFGHDPNNVTCNCCGEDYVINAPATLRQESGYHRGCPHIVEVRNPKTGLFTDGVPNDKYYYEPGEDVPEGWKIEASGWSDYQTLEEYCASEFVMLIHAKDIRPGQRIDMSTLR